MKKMRFADLCEGVEQVLIDDGNENGGLMLWEAVSILEAVKEKLLNDGRKLLPAINKKLKKL